MSNSSPILHYIASKCIFQNALAARNTTFIIQNTINSEWKYNMKLDDLIADIVKFGYFVQAVFLGILMLRQLLASNTNIVPKLI